jgi:hypothetical protein
VRSVGEDSGSRDRARVVCEVMYVQSSLGFWEREKARVMASGHTRKIARDWDHHTPQKPVW